MQRYTIRKGVTLSTRTLMIVGVIALTLLGMLLVLDPVREWLFGLASVNIMDMVEGIFGWWSFLA